jgi:hypothetical protein
MQGSSAEIRDNDCWFGKKKDGFQIMWPSQKTSHKTQNASQE